MDISSLLEVEVKEGKASDLQNNGEIAAYKNIPDFSIRVTDRDDVVSSKSLPSSPISHDERHFYKLMFGSDIASVRFRKLHCTACDLHIGSAPADAHNMHEHPVLHVLLCTACRNFYGDGTFEQGDDATDMFCRWCANGGNLYCCSYCSNTFCYNCIKRNFDPMVRKKIERDEKWKCFVCNPADLYTARASCWALLQHVQTVTRILQTDRKMSPAEIEAKMNLDESQCCPHRKKRKRSETVSDNEDEDETFQVPKRKRRKYLNARRKRRMIKVEMNDVATTERRTSNERTNDDRIAMKEFEAVYYMNERRNRGVTKRGTNNEDDDNSSKLSFEELPLAVRQRNRRLREESMNLTKFSINDDEIPPPLLECDQSMIEGAESLTFGVTQTPSVGNAELMHNIGINPVPMMNLMKRPNSGPLTRGGKTHRLIRGIGGTPVLVRKIAPANSQNSSTSTIQSLPMVTIPPVNHVQTVNRLSVIQSPSGVNRDKEKLNAPTIRPMRSCVRQKSNVTETGAKKSPNDLAPSVIDLDSDSDDPVVILTPSSSQNRQNTPGERVPDLSTKTHPVKPDDGLMIVLSLAPNDDNGTSSDKRRNKAAKTFDQMIRGPTKSIDNLLDSLKSKLKKIMESATLFPPEKELITAKAKTRAVNRTIKRTVAELTSLNDNLVRAYHAYKRERMMEKVSHTESIVLKSREKSHRITSLDMECTRESEPEFDVNLSDDDDNDENLPNFPTIREIRPFRKRINRAVEAKPQTKNKSIQVYDVQPRDCEKSIGYALLLKADYDGKRERDVLRPVKVPDENFGKYEEEFIRYLQQIEDNGIETEETKDLSPQSQNTISINELIESDISAIIKEIAASCDDKSYDITKENLDENVEILEEHVEIFTTTTKSSDFGDNNLSDASNNIDDDIRTSLTTPETKENSTSKDKATNDIIVDPIFSEIDRTTNENEESSSGNVTNATVSLNISETTERKKNIEQTNNDETVLAVTALLEDKKSENNGKKDTLNSWKSVESDDECTILD